HAHLLRSRRPTPAANVPAPSSNNAVPEIRPPKPRNAAAPGLFSAHNRSNSALGQISETPATAAIAVAANRKAATNGTVLGLCAILLRSIVGRILPHNPASPAACPVRSVSSIPGWTSLRLVHPLEIGHLRHKVAASDFAGLFLPDALPYLWRRLPP